MKPKPYTMFLMMLADKLKKLIIDIAKENKHIGVRMLHGCLKYLGLKIQSTTIFTLR